MKKMLLYCGLLCQISAIPISASCNNINGTIKPKEGKNDDTNTEIKINVPKLTNKFNYKEKAYTLIDTDTWKTYENNEKWRYDYEAVADENSWMEQKIKDELSFSRIISEVNTPSNNGLISKNIPSIAFISKYIRNLDFTNPNKFVKKQDNSHITVKEYRYLLKKLKDILSPSITTPLQTDKYDEWYIVSIIKQNDFKTERAWNNFINDIKDLSIFSYYANDKASKFGLLNEYFIPAKNWLINHKYWTNSSSFGNVAFDHENNDNQIITLFGLESILLFYEGSSSSASFTSLILNNEYPNFQYKPDNIVLNNLVVGRYLVWQMLQYKLLKSYLDFLNMLISVNEDLTLEEYIHNEINKEIINKYYEAIIDYLTVKNVLGLTIPTDENFTSYNLMLFPGLSYTPASDYQDTYLWAKEQLENIVLPLMYDAKDETKSWLVFKILFNEHFKNGNKEDKYQLIWTALEKSTGEKKPSVPDDATLESKQKEINKYIRELLAIKQ
ncbi:MAG3960 family lipoprotein [Mycoplasma sp. Z244B]|uniref:MAG3960 family lipoprotein n=1 Tax=Mycoplasma sp. Z244B TaxID=3401659 RepID=UPI003AAE506C